MDLENCFCETGSDKLFVKMMNQKLNARFKRMENKGDKGKVLAVVQNKNDEKLWQFGISNNSKGWVGLVLNMATRLLIVPTKIKWRKS